MASVFDVAAYILEKQGPMTAMKLQKLCYYAQAWSVVWDEKPIFQARIETWANGPVIPRLFARHAGWYRVGPGDLAGDPKRLTNAERETVDAILRHYGRMSSHDLSELTHREAPWREAREGLKPGQRSKREISLAALDEYYGSLIKTS